jgi:hypothetical protein
MSEDITKDERTLLEWICSRPSDFSEGWELIPRNQMDNAQKLSTLGFVTVNCYNNYVPTQKGLDALNDKYIYPPKEVEGVKYDNGKPRMSLLFTLGSALLSVLDIIEYGAAKYPSADNWKKLPNGQERYTDAALRHLQQSFNEDLDKESGKPHLAHAACNLLFALWHKNETK